MKYLLVTGWLLLFSATDQIDKRNLLGKYFSVKNSPEKSSELELKTNYRFTYSYRSSGCQGEIQGGWVNVNGKIKFTNDPEFIDKSKALYPDLSLVNWSIHKNGIKPDGALETGCFIEKNLHRKEKLN